jgi:hypothetical protein
MDNVLLGEPAKGIALKVDGDESTGYYVTILYKNNSIAYHNNQGEFTVVFENGDHSIQCDLTDWKAETWSKDGNTLTLNGRVFLEPLHTYVTISVKYSLANEHVVEKKIALQQHNASLLYYRLTNTLVPVTKPQSFWSFEQEDCIGGPIFEMYPAAGFKCEDGLAIGLLTDTGYNNQWTRNVKRRTLKGGMMALNRTPDVEFVKVANEEERSVGKDYVEFNFGEIRDYRLGTSNVVTLPDQSEWRAVDGGIIIPVRLKKTSFYRLKFKYKTDLDNLRIRLTDQSRSHDYSFNFFDKEIQKSPEDWTELTRKFLPIRMIPEEEMAYLYIGSNDRSPDFTKEGKVELEDIELIEKTSSLEAYNPIRAGETVEKRMFIFADQANSLRELRIASQVRLAEGYGFEGTEAEKIFFADRQMLIWIPEPDDFTPHLVPSLGYSMDMYNRDSFWTAAAWYDKDVNEGVYKKWALSIDDAGCTRTIWTPYVGDLENSPNESNMYFIIWSYINKQRFNSDIDVSVVQHALNYCRNTFDPFREGKYICRTPAWMDVIWLKEGVMFAVNQGLYVNALKCAKELGCDVSDEEISNAIKAYKSLYDEKVGYFTFADKSYEKWDSISPSSLMGEFVSFWLWDEGILTDEAVINTLEALPVYSGCSPCLVDGKKEFFERKNKPFEAHFYTEPGVYINGGSWFLYEYFAYVAGLRHGWEKAHRRIEDRLHAEFNIYPDEPFSHEHIALDAGHSDCYHKVFGWNSFMLIANEVAGLRKPHLNSNLIKILEK